MRVFAPVSLMILPLLGQMALAGDISLGPWSQRDFIDQKVDVHAQRALYSAQNQTQADIVRNSFLYAALTNGSLDGVFKVDTGGPALRAKGLGKGWWTILPKGEGAICWKEPSGARPMMVFSGSVAPHPGPLAAELADAYDQCGFGEIGVLGAPDSERLHRYTGPGGLTRTVSTVSTSSTSLIFIAGPPGAYTLYDASGDVIEVVRVEAGERKLVELGPASTGNQWAADVTSR